MRAKWYAKQQQQHFIDDKKIFAFIFKQTSRDRKKCYLGHESINMCAKCGSSVELIEVLLFGWEEHPLNKKLIILKIPRSINIYKLKNTTRMLIFKQKKTFQLITKKIFN
jgi:hypothetical protein